MSDNVEISLLGVSNGVHVVQLPHRRYPGMIVQGDTVHSWIGLARECQRHLGDGTLTEAKDCIEELQSILQAYLGQYEVILDQKQIKHPY